MKYILLVFFSIVFFDSEVLVAQEDLLSSESPHQKIFLHTDRDYYTTGGQIFYKVYVRSGSGKLSNVPSENLYLDLINSEGQIVSSQIVLINKGIGAAQINVDQSLTTGKYVLRAYTDHIKEDTEQYFRKIIYVNSRLPEINMSLAKNDTVYLNLLPEGGQLIDGIENRISFIATNYQGLPIQANFSATYLDNSIALSTNVNGMGAISLIPRRNAKLLINSSIKLKYNWPTIIKNGIGINCLINEEELTINLKSNLNQNHKLIIHHQGKALKEELLSAQDNKIIFELDKLPPGIIHCTVLSENGSPIAERLVFNHFRADNFNIEIATNKAEFAPRERVIMQLDLYDDEGVGLPSELSVSVVDDYIVRPISDNPDIVAHNYLNSNLSNLIKNPNQYFNWEDEELVAKTDLLMRVYGWRKFKQLENLNQNKEITINGYITRKDRENVRVKAQGFISFLNNNLAVLPFVTDLNGNLSINNLQFFGEQDIMVQAEVFNKKKKTLLGDEIKMSGNRNVDINLADRDKLISSLLDSALIYEYPDVKDQALIVAETESIQFSMDDTKGDVAMSIDLDEVSITEEKIDEVIESYRPSMYYFDPNDRIRTSRIQNLAQYRDIYDVLRGRVTGLIFDGPDEGSAARKKVILRGYTAGGLLTSDAASFFINGNFVPQVQAEAINPMDIAFIDVVKSLNQLAAYGEAGVNGIVFIYLKPPGLRQSRQPETYNGILNTTIKGYAEMRTFYSPNYAIDNPEDFDNRITIHWEPSVEVDDNGTAYIEFYTADKSTIYKVDVQGVTKEGLPMSANATIFVR